MPGTNWVVRGKLAQGGVGIALDVAKEQLIRGAMKVLLPPFAKQREFAAKFFEKVKVTTHLQYANIVQMLDFDRLLDGTPFMVMVRLRGQTLRAALPGEPAKPPAEDVLHAADTYSVMTGRSRCGKGQWSLVWGGDCSVGRNEGATSSAPTALRRYERTRLVAASHRGQTRRRARCSDRLRGLRKALAQG